MAQGSAASQHAAFSVDGQRFIQTQNFASASSLFATGAAVADGWTRMQQRNSMDAKRTNVECWEASTRLNPVLRASSVRTSNALGPGYYTSPASQAEEQWLQVLRDHFQRQQQELVMMEQQEVKQLRAEHFKQLEKLEYQQYRTRDRFESETCRQQVEQMEQQQRQELRHLQQLYEDVKRKLPIKQEEYLRHMQMQMRQGQLQTRQVCSCDAAKTSTPALMETHSTTTTTSHRSQQELEELESIAQVALRSMLGAKSPTNENDSSRGDLNADCMNSKQLEASTSKDQTRIHALLSQQRQQWTDTQHSVANRRGQDGRSDSQHKHEPNNAIPAQQSASLRFRLPTLTQMQQPRVFRA